MPVRTAGRRCCRPSVRTGRWLSRSTPAEELVGLFNHVADVIIIAGTRGAPSWIKVKRKIDIHFVSKSEDLGFAGQIAVARVWVTLITNGVPVGVQIAWLLRTSRG